MILARQHTYQIPCRYTLDYKHKHNEVTNKPTFLRLTDPLSEADTRVACWEILSTINITNCPT